MPDGDRIPVDNEELLTPREFRREFAKRLEALRNGDLDKLVLIQHNEMVAVVLPLDRYAALLRAEDGE
jgi:hypothetical protein